MQQNNENYRSPIIHAVPQNEERLIDTGMLHFESSVAGYNERYHRGETSHTIHVWWARRPHSAMRSLVFSSLCKDKSDESLSVMANLAMKCNPDDVKKAREILRREYPAVPKILDMFGGGGTIPFEAKRLGLDAYSIDSNQLSVFIQKCNMVYADRINLKRAEELVQEKGIEILDNLTKRSAWLYPLRASAENAPFGYIWTYRTTCPHCGRKFLISKRPWLSKKNGCRVAFISKELGNNTEGLEVTNLASDQEPFSPPWIRRTGVLKCPICGQLLKDVNVLKCEDVMTAYVENRAGSGKDYIDAEQQKAIPELSEILTEEKAVLQKLNAELPDSELPVWSGVVNPALYGIKTHADFLNHRQRLFLLYLIDELSNQYDELAKDSTDMAKFVVGALSSLIDQVVDWNCRLSMWIPQNEQVGRAFCGPGVAMLFDYAETDQVMHGPANLWDKLKRIVNGVKSFENCDGTIHVQQAHAQSLPFSAQSFDAIVTDPPYYDNIYYSILADFFYAWKKILLKKIEPDLFRDETTDYSYELVASSRRVKKGQSAHEEYCKQLSMAFNEAARVLKPDGIFTFVYSHSSVNGWQAVVQAYRQSPFIVNNVQPLSIERKGRPRAVMSKAVNTCVAIVARKSSEKNEALDIQTVLEKTSEYIDSFGKKLIDTSGWGEADAGLAVLACVAGLLSNSSNITGIENDQQALIAASELIREAFQEFTLKIRDSI